MLQEQITLPVGSTIRSPHGDRYLIEGLLGAGGSGAVYLVRERQGSQRLFALKEVIEPNRREHERFLFEAELLKRLHHRALPRVYQVFEHDKSKRVYMLMDYVEGRTLEELRREHPGEPFPLPVVVALMTPIADALAYLHHHSPPIVHRDVKPGNIIVPLEGEETVLVDFSIAKEYIKDNTTAVIRHGTPGYAALEQYAGGTTPQTDIYGLGATIYALLTGVTPPDAITRATAGQGCDPLETAHLLAPDLPWSVTWAIEKALSISSHDRFATIEEFWQELTGNALEQQAYEEIKSSLETLQPPTPPERTYESITITPALKAHSHRISRAKTWSFLLSIVLALLIVISGASLFVLRHGSLFSTSQGKAASLASSTPHSKTTSTAAPSITPLSPGNALYPVLAVAYGGTVLDLMSGEKTDMFLTYVRQNQGSIRGYFQGLGLSGPFEGTVTRDGRVQFTVQVQSGGPILLFQGNIKIGGDMTGIFEALDSHGQGTGESGIWNVAPGT